MDRASIVMIVVFAGYVGFEINAVRMSQHLFEPLATFDRFVAMDHATDRCGSPEAELRQRFSRNYASVRRRAGEDLAEADPQKSPEEIEEMLVARTGEGEAEVDALIDAEGCAGREVWMLLDRYEKRARLNVH